MRQIWQIVWLLLFRPSPRVFHAWRRLLLRSFRARIDRGARIYPSVRVWAPWQLEMGEFACLGPDVDCYNVAHISLGRRCIVSQYSYLCAASHGYNDLAMPLVAKPIRLSAYSWIAADVFVGPGVTIGEGAVVGARSSIYRDLPPWTVAVGNPARVIKLREKPAAPPQTTPVT